MQAILSTLFISIVPVVLIYLMNKIFISEKTRETVTLYMMSFAVGGLLGDVFFHTLPHISGGHSHSHEGHSHGHGGHAHDPAEMANNFVIVLGIVAFFLMEKVVHQYFHAGHDHGHDHKKKVHPAE